jgi:site-specific recombinase XerD
MPNPPAQDSARPHAVSDDELVERWLAAHARTHAASAETQRAYRREVRRFRAWVGKSLRYVTYGDVNRFVAHLDQEVRLEPSSVARAVAALRSLFDFALPEGVMRQGNPTHMVALPTRSRRPPPSLLGSRQVWALLEASAELSLRDRLLVLSVLVLGCRPNEAGSLRWGDFVRDSEDRLGCVIAVGEKGERTVAVPGELASLFFAWRQELKMSGPWDRFDRRYLFGPRGTHPLSQGSVRRLVSAACRRLLGERAPTLHLLRLSGASLALLAGQQPSQLASDWDLTLQTVTGLQRISRSLAESTPLHIWPQA